MPVSCLSSWWIDTGRSAHKRLTAIIRAYSMTRDINCCEVCRDAHEDKSCPIVAVTKLHALRPRKEFNSLSLSHFSPFSVALSQYSSVSSFATLRVLSCHHQPGLRGSCSNVVLFSATLKQAVWWRLLTAPNCNYNCRSNFSHKMDQNSDQRSITFIHLFIHSNLR